MPKLVVGSFNNKKLVELHDLLGDLGIELVNLSGYPSITEVDETGNTFVENANLKASQYAKQVNEYVLAEDSGLVVPILNGEPGVFSARYAGTHGDDQANNRKLLERLGDTPDPQREAYYVCVASLAAPNGEIVATTEGRCWGRIVREPRGTGGFGYDPLFEVIEFHKTFGELSLRVKQALSHRARAIVKLRPILVRVFSQSNA
jgi:XTP/dITP diphosphohydrolase